MEYKELDGYIYSDQIIERDIDDMILTFDYKSKEFYDFITCICYDATATGTENKLNSLITIIGYLLHNYKNPANSKAVILMDEDHGIRANGGTGKGILLKALGYIRNTVPEDGKLFKVKGQFSFSRVDWGTRILGIDDVPEDFDFERVFPLITEGVIVERKYQNKFKIPFKESPKVIITTNYTVMGDGQSHDRRKIEFELSGYFKADHTPEDKYDHLLFFEWNSEEWTAFYAAMMNFVKEYLEKGIIKPASLNVYFRRLRQTVGLDFVNFLIENVDIGVKYDKKVIFDKFNSKFPSLAIENQKSFTLYLKYYAIGFNYEINESHSGDINYFTLKMKPEENSET